jgi:hypothetical protein
MRKTSFLGREAPLPVAVGTLALLPLFGLLLGVSVGYFSNLSKNGLPDPPPKVKQLDSNILPAGEDVVSSSDSAQEPPKEYHPGGVSYLLVDNEYDSDEEVVSSYKPGGLVYEPSVKYTRKPDENEFKSDEDEFKSDEDSNFLTAGEEVVSSYKPGGLVYSAKEGRREWYEQDLIEWAKNRKDFYQYSCETCKKRFLDGEISIIEEKLERVQDNKEYLNYTFGVKCDCVFTHTVNISGSRTVPELERKQWKKKIKDRNNSKKD